MYILQLDRAIQELQETKWKEDPFQEGKKCVQRKIALNYVVLTHSVRSGCGIHLKDYNGITLAEFMVLVCSINGKM